MASTGFEKKRRRADANDRTAPHKKRKVPREDDSLLDMDTGVNRAISFMDSQLQADYLAKKTAQFGTDLTKVELSDLSISANAIKDSTSWQRPRTLENLPAFLEEIVDDPSKLGEAPSQNGSPHTIIVAGAALRAVDIVRTMRKFQSKNNTVAKLFAKHIKMDEAVAFLKSRRTGIAVGTPVRLMGLLDNGALSVSAVKRIVVDASHIDQKKRGIMDMKETALPLARWLARKEFVDRYTSSDQRLELVFY